MVKVIQPLCGGNLDSPKFINKKVSSDACTCTKVKFKQNILLNCLWPILVVLS